MLNKKVILLTCLPFFFSCSSDENKPIPDSQTEVEFVKILGGSNNERANAITKTNDGGYAIVGYAQSNDGDIIDKSDASFDYWVTKFDANDNLQWSKTFGGSNDDRASSIIQTSDGGFAIFGFSSSSDGDSSNNNGFQDYWITKLDISGNLSWQKSFGFAGADIGVSIIQTNDNGYILSGVLDVTSSGGEGNSRNAFKKHAGGDFWVIKLNASGDRQWWRYYGGSFTDTPFGVVQTQDNGYIIAGSSDSNDVDISNNKGQYDFWVIKISNEGVLIWEKTFGGSEIDEARAIVPTHDGNYAIVGDTRSNDDNVSNNNGAADLWVIKISPNGNLLSEKTFGGSSFDVGRSIRLTSDNGFIISGSSRSANGILTINNGQNDAWVLKLDSSFNLEWQKTIGGSQVDFFYDATQLNDGSFIAVGESSSSDFDIPENKGFSDALIIKIK